MLLAWCVCTFALDPSLDISQYGHTSWKIRDGFTRGIILSIAQTPDGYLWLGTEFALLRFDGVRAIPWQPPAGAQLPSNSVSNVLVSHDGTLWIGTFKGLASWKDGKFSTYSQLAGSAIFSLVQDHERTVWVGAADGTLCAIRGDKIDCDKFGPFGRGVFSIYEDREHNLWVSAQTGLWRWAPGPPHHYASPHDVTEINGIAEDDDDGTLLLASNGGVKQLVDGKISNYPGLPVAGQIRPSRFLRTSDGSLWIGANQGLWHVHNGRADGFASRDGLSGDTVLRMFEDREGNVWVSTVDGLDRFREVTMPTISVAQGLSNSSSWAVQATTDGSIWIATAGGLNRWQNGHVTAYRSKSALAQNGQRDESEAFKSGRVTEVRNSGLTGRVVSLGLDHFGRPWISTSDGIFYFEADKFVKVLRTQGVYVTSILGDRRGNVWISQMHGGISIWSPEGQVQQIPESKLSNKSPRTALLDAGGDGVWTGLFEGGLVLLDHGEVRTSYSPADGLGDGRVNHLRYGPRGGLWVSTEGGLSRIKDGKIATLTSKNGLPCNEVHWSEEDNEHSIWLYMPCGLVRIARSELDAWITDSNHNLKTTVFGSSEGVRTVSVYGGYGPRVTKSPDGRIWFLPRDGVSVIDPRHLPVNQFPPPVSIEQVTGDGKTYDASNGLSMPPHVRDLIIDYTALSLVAPETTHFRYKLEGQDPDWKEVVNERRVQYSNLAPRAYTFRVMASNNSGVWNEAGASLEFSVQPAFYQTIWFRACCLSAFLLLLVGIYELRVQQLHRQYVIRLNERTRIARELHDTMLQDFQGAVFQMQAARNLLLRRPEQAVPTLEEAIAMANGAVNEGRDAIQGLRSEPMGKGNLAELLKATSHQLANNENGNQLSPAFNLIEEGKRQTFSATTWKEVCRIALEILRNAYQHAQAQRIEAEIRYGDSMFRLRIRDDGKGIDPKVLEEGGKAGHWGLRGLRERADRIGARLDVWSEPGKGTEVQLLVPASIAYEKLPDSYRAKLVQKLKGRLQRS